MPADAYFPGIGSLLQVARAWPRVFAQPPAGTVPVALQEGRLVVLCGDDEQLALIHNSSEEIVRTLNRLLDGDVIVERMEAIEATRTELFLAREVLALKSWLVDFDVGI
jgi:hypothetical protein